VHEIKAFAARMTGIPESNVRAVADDVGGGFGQKIMVLREEPAVIMAAFKLGGAPVKWIEDRRENLMASNQARSEETTLTFAVDDAGHILAVKAEFFEEVGAYPPSAGAMATMAIGMFTGPYKIPVLIPSCLAVYTNTVGKTAYRGPWAMETIFREQMMDVVAREIGIDPVEFRRINMITPGELPYTTATQMVLENITPSETLEQVVEVIDVPAPPSRRRRYRGRLLGLGIAGYVEPSAVAFGAQLRPGGDLDGHQRQGQVRPERATTGTASRPRRPGRGDHLGCDIDDVAIIQGDTTASPLGPAPAAAAPRSSSAARPRRRRSSCARSSSRSPPICSRPAPTTSRSPTASCR
jgi:carbon-monoxide dehydrogenase large subunit